jgi:hypothetical protein
MADRDVTRLFGCDAGWTAPATSVADVSAAGTARSGEPLFAFARAARSAVHEVRETR